MGVNLLSDYAKHSVSKDYSDIGLNMSSMDLVMDSVMELNMVCGMIMPSQKEVDQAMNRTIENVSVAGRRVNRGLKNFVKGAILPVVKLMTHQKARAKAKADANDKNTF